MQTNTLAYAKIVRNSKLNMLRLLVTFDTVSDKVTVLNANFKSGDLCDADADASIVAQAIKRAMQRASLELRTNNIVQV